MRVTQSRCILAVILGAIITLVFVLPLWNDVLIILRSPEMPSISTQPPSNAATPSTTMLISSSSIPIDRVSEAPTGLLQTSQWDRYTNDAYGFEIEYPPHFRVIESTNEVSFVLDSEDSRVQLSPFVVIHLYGDSSAEYGNWISSAVGIRRRIGEDSYKYNFEDVGEVRWRGIPFHLFRHGVSDSVAELVTYNPQRKIIFSLELYDTTEVDLYPYIAEREDVRALLQSFRFIGP